MEIIEAYDFSINYSDEFGITVEIVIDNNKNFPDTISQVNVVYDGVILKLDNQFILLKIEHITDVKNVQIPFASLEFSAPMVKKPNPKTYKNGIKIKGIIEKCEITKNKDDLTKYLI